MTHELESFYRTWEEEAARTAKLLKTLPEDRGDYRPDPKSRSLAELAWHLAEVEIFMVNAILAGKLSVTDRPPGLERPATVAEFAHAYERTHRDLAEKLRAQGDLDLDRGIPFPSGHDVPVRHVLWNAILHHLIHHRGQVALMIRLAGGRPFGLYGPTREDMEAMRAKG